MPRKNPHVGGDAGADVRAWIARDPALSACIKERLAEYDVARKIKQARLAANLSQTELAERAGTAQTVIARIERGANMPKLELLTKIAAGLGLRLVVKLERPRKAA